MASGTLAQIRARVRNIFREAVADGYMGADPTATVKRVKVARTEHPGIALDFDQAARLQEIGETLYSIGESRLWPAVFTALSVGLRRGETMGLRWVDVDFENNTIHIRVNLTSPSGKPELRRPKTEESIRDIPMPSSLKAMLYRHREVMIQEALDRDDTVRPSLPVFCTTLGTFTHPDNLARALIGLLDWSESGMLKRRDPKDKTKIIELSLEQRLKSIDVRKRSRLEAVSRAGNPLPKISPHDLRHTAGTLMLRRDMPIEVVSKILGHADIAITYRVYRHVLESEKRAAIVDLFAAPIPDRGVRPMALN
jgi:integrase